MDGDLLMKENNNFNDMQEIMKDIGMITCVNGSQAHDLYGFGWYKMHHNETANYLDIGTRFGNSAIILASSLKHQDVKKYNIPSMVYTVDNYSQFLEGTKEEEAEKARYNMSCFGIDDMVSFHVMDDIEFVNSLPDNSIDMVFDDSYHSYMATWDRLNSYIPKLKDNSLIVVHDYYIEFPSIIKAVGDFVSENKEITFGLNYINGFGWFFCKPNVEKFVFNFQRKVEDI